jgi:hypothetical protein
MPNFYNVKKLRDIWRPEPDFAKHRDRACLKLIKLGLSRGYRDEFDP